MRILFVPNAGAITAHLFPLVALANRLEGGRHQTAFLLPKHLHAPFRAKNRNVIELDYQLQLAVHTEMRACGQFRPDVIVDDLSPTVYLVAKAANVPRVVIRRTGDLPIARRDPFAHSMLRNNSTYFAGMFGNCEAVWGFPSPQSIAEMAAADMNVVAGSSSVEVLPAELRDDPCYVYAGPLILPDSESFGYGDETAAAIARFFQVNAQRRIVYLTVGTIIEPTAAVRSIIRYMLRRGVAVISTVDLADVEPAYADLHYHASFVPMHAVCSRADLMIHHCGSGTYQYAIEHGVPAICLGSGFYDRDDVGFRLTELGVAKYIPHTLDDSSLRERFASLFDGCADTAGDWYRSAKERLATLRAENERTTAAFDLEAVLANAVSFHQQKRPKR